MSKTKKILQNLKKSFFVKLTFFYGILWSVTAPVIILQISANDFWKAMYSGRYIARTLRMPDHTEFTFSPAVQYFPPDLFTWLGNLFFYGFYEFLGIYGLQIFRVGIALFAVILLHSMIRFRCSPLLLLGMISFVFALKQKLLVRNAIFLIPFTIILFWSWYYAKYEDNLVCLGTIPFLFAFWGNIHVTYLLGFTLFALLIIGDFLDFYRGLVSVDFKWLKRISFIFLLVLLILVFLKPSPDPIIFNITSDFIELVFTGTVNFQHPADSYDTTTILGGLQYSIDSFKAFLMSSIIERPVDPKVQKQGALKFPLKLPGHIFNTVSWVILAVALGSLFLNMSSFRYSLFLPLVFASILGLMFVRSVAMISLVAYPILIIRNKLNDFSAVRMGRIVSITALTVIILLGTNIAYLVWSNQLFIFTGQKFQSAGFGKHMRYSDAVPEYVLKNYPDKRFYNGYNTGTYLIWKWWPEKKVFIDSKSLAYDQRFMNNYYNTTLEQLIAKKNFKFVIIEMLDGSAYNFFIPHTQWELDAFDKSFFVFKKTKEASDVNPDTRLLYDDDEFKTLSDFAQVRLMAVKDFMRKYQNDPKMRGVLNSPFHRVRRDDSTNMQE